MKRRMLNVNLTPHFSRYEVIEGATIPTEGVQMNWNNISQYNEDLFIPLLEDMELVRGMMNLMYRSSNSGREIGLRINSGWRCRKWELHRGRSGDSQHVKAAVDVQPSNCSASLAVEIMLRLHGLFWGRVTGYPGGYALSPSKTVKNEIITIGFLHFDKRGTNARWAY